MKLSSSYHIALLLSVAYASYSNTNSGTPPQIQPTFFDAEEVPNEKSYGQNNDSPKKPTIEHLKHVLAAGLVKTCETHHVDELNAHLYAPEDGSTFSSTVSNNSDVLVHRIKRMLGIEPTISISAGAVFTPEETQPKIRFKNALLKFAGNADLPCKQTVDSNGNKTVVCTIVLTLKEFYALKEQYKKSNP